MQLFDRILNRFTMYRVVLYGLMGFLAVAEMLALAGILSISAAGLLGSIAILMASCFGANKLIAGMLNVPYNTESWLITSLILACILPQATSWAHSGGLLLAGVLAMASKYVLVNRQGSHIFNPAAIAAVVMSTTGLLPATWWIATPVLLPFTTIVAVIVLRKQRKYTLFIVFAVTVLAMLLFLGSVLRGWSVISILHDAAASWPIVFFGSIMLDEPSTLPPTNYYQLLYAVLVGSIFGAQLHVGNLSSSPEVSLVFGNVFTVLVTPAAGAMLRLKSITQLSHDIYDLAFERPVKMPQFLAGQYMEWTLPHAKTDSRGNRRTFSLASSPTESDVHIGIRRANPGSSFKTALLSLQPGKYIRVAHAAGDFVLPTDISRPLLFIAGGVGITPMRSMIKYLLDTHQQRDIVLVYLTSAAQDAIYRDVFEQANVIGLNTHYVTSRLDATTLAGLVPDATRRTVYISGPDAMVSHYKSVAQHMGVPMHHIKTDHFTGY